MLPAAQFVLFARQHPFALVGFMIYCAGWAGIIDLAVDPAPIGPNHCATAAGLLVPTLAVLITSAYWVLMAVFWLFDSRRRRLYRKLWLASASIPATLVLTILLLASFTR